MMVKELRLRNFRSFTSFEIRELGQVNLLVGQNNSGKTSILEALSLLFATDPRALYTALIRRGEEVWDDSEGAKYREVDIRRLFNGFNIEPGSRFQIDAKTSNRRMNFQALVGEPLEDDEILSNVVDEGF